LVMSFSIPAHLYNLAGINNESTERDWPKTIRNIVKLVTALRPLTGAA
jgi:hypothetical protein